MKIYKLLKNLPTIKAGTIFEEREQYNDKILVARGIGRMYEIDVELIEDFDDWFEEIDENVFYFIDVLSPDKPIQKRNIDESSDWFIERLKSLGNYFATEQEAEKHIEWLKARAVLIQDTKGFKPDWHNGNEEKYYGVWNAKTGELGCLSRMSIKHDDIYFETVDDVGYSFKTHEKEWKIYLGVEK